MKVVVDANVMISAGSARGLCEAVVELCLEQHDLVTSETVLTDVKEKLIAKLKVPPTIAREFCQTLRESGSLTEACAVPPDACRDADDVHLLGLAGAVHADFLITGDNDLLFLKRYGQTQIVTPRQFWNSIVRT